MEIKIALLFVDGRQCGLLTLAKHIGDQLNIEDSCTVLETAINGVWPLKLTEAEIERNTQIHLFASLHGWSAAISDPGVRVTFRKLPGPVGEYG